MFDIEDSTHNKQQKRKKKDYITKGYDPLWGGKGVRRYHQLVESDIPATDRNAITEEQIAKVLKR
jgi:hypothetical protein